MAIKGAAIGTTAFRHRCGCLSYPVTCGRGNGYHFHFDRCARDGDMMRNVILERARRLATFLGLTLVLSALASSAAFAACTGTSPNIVCTAAGPITLNSTTAASDASPQTASAYPSNNVVSGIAGTITSVQVRLNGLTHSWAHDLDMVLVSPSGQAFVFWSDVGPGDDLTPVVLSNQTFTIGDGAASSLPQGTPASGSFRPANYGAFVDSWPTPASLAATAANSAAPFGTQTFASRFNGANPNGTWQLYIALDSGGPDTGSLQSWDLIFSIAASTAATTTAVSSSANPVQIPLSGNSTANVTATVTSGGNPVTLGNVSFFKGAQILAANVPVNGSGQAGFTFNTTGVTPPVLGEGTHTITANYSGATGFGASGGSITQVVDRATQVTGRTYCNAGTITVPTAIGGASVYPSKIFVSGLSGSTQSVVMDIKGFTNPATEDVNMLLVSPTGQKFVPFAFISDSAGATSGANIKLDDLAGNTLPNSGPVASGTYRPSHGPNGSGAPLTFVAPAPAGPYGSAAPGGSSTFASSFSGASPNGTWTLYVYNWANTPAAGTREITNGWCITLGTSSDPATTTTASVAPSPSALNQSATVAALVANASTGDPVNGQGAVTFKEGGTTLAGPLNVGANGVASFAKSDFIQGAHFVDAYYSGAPGLFGVSNGQVLHYVDAATTNPSAGRYCNATPLTFPNAIASGAPYPTRVIASGLAGVLSKVTIELNGLTHQAPDDLDLMLTGPNGTSVIAFSDVGGLNAVSGLNIVLDSTAANALPDSSSLTSGTFLPTDFQVGVDTFAAPAPTANVFSASTTTLGTAFNNGDPNGIWTLWTQIDGAGVQGGGSLGSGWCVNLTTTPPVLTIAKTHAGNFTQGQTGAQYTVTVGSAGPGSTAGIITVVDTVPSGLAVTGMSGDGWTCTVGTRTCTTAAVLAASGSLPPITVSVDVASNAASPQVNSVTVSGGGATGASTTDSTIITPITNLTINVPAGISFTFNGQTVTGTQTFQVAPGMYPLSTTTPQSLGAGARAVFTSWSDAGAISHNVTVGSSPLTITGSFATQFQLTTAAGAGGTVTPASGTFFDSGAVVNVTAMPNSGFLFGSWTGPVADAGAAATTVTMDAPKSISANFAAQPDLTITKTIQGVGPFLRGGQVTFNLTVHNAAAGSATSAAYTVTDNAPTGLSFTGASGSDWSCTVSASLVSCNRSTPIPASSSAAVITLVANIAADAPVSITNTANVAGGGEFITGNNSGSAKVDVPLVPPTVTAVAPGHGPTAGGTAVTITGTDFIGATAVTIGGAAATGVIVVDGTTITATTPAGSEGAASVLVTTTGGTNAANALYTYVTPIRSVSGNSPTDNPGTITASFTGGGGGCGYGASQFIPLVGNAVSPPAGSAPIDVGFPYGLFNFTVTDCEPGSVLDFTITYPTALPPGTQYWKYGRTPGGGANDTPHWYVLPAVISGNTVAFSIADGGLGDDDLTANGSIVDPGGPAVLPPPPVPTPTSSHWMLALMALVLLGFGARYAARNSVR
jgi:subtilisin-like proprotein convertase family protein